MKKFAVDKLRNVGLIAHSGAGKTSLAEAMLFDSGVTNRLGRVDDGNATLDYDPEEIDRNISINAATAPAVWNNTKINIVDTPGYFDFVGEVKAALRVVDGAIVVLDCVSGVEVGTELVWRYANEYALPRVAFLNKMDRENANFQKVLDDMREFFGDNIVPIQVPIGKEEDFKGIVDLLTRKSYIWDGGKEPTVGEVPDELVAQVDELREMLVEGVAEANDELLMKYLEGEELTDKEVANALATQTAKGEVVPVLCGSATKNIGVQLLLDAITELMPSPAGITVAGINPKNDEEVTRTAGEGEPFSALIYKTMADPYVGKLTLFRTYSGFLKSDTSVYNASKGTTERIGQLFLMKGKEQIPVDEVHAGDLAAVAKLAETTTSDTICAESSPIVFKPIQFPKPVFAVAVEPKAKGDEEKIGSGLTRLAEEDPTLTFVRDSTTKELVISGMGEQHLDVTTARLARKFGVDVIMKTPKIAYRETVRSEVEAEGRHKKQSGGRGQFGHCLIRMAPLPRGEEFEFVDDIFGGSIPRQYIPAVEKGVRESMDEGPLAGYPVVDVRVTVFDGSYHSVDSSEMAFKIAGSLAFKKAFEQANPVLLEPIYKVEILVPDQFMGDVMGDLNKKRGKILGMEPQGATQVIKALVPLAEMQKYAIDLRSITQGRGTYTMEFDHYEEVPAQVADSVIAEAKKAEDE